MRSGQLNKRIELQAATQTSDGMGGFTETWATRQTVWAAIWPMSAREMMQTMQTTMEISHRIRIRYKSGLLPSWRIKYGTRYFNIVSIVNPNEKGEWQDLLCREVL